MVTAAAMLLPLAQPPEIKLTGVPVKKAEAPRAAAQFSWHALMRRELAAFRGHEVDTAGDGLLATFDGPARAIRCACSVREKVHALGLQVRIGLHTGECEPSGEGVVGIAVHIGARVAETARPD